MVFVATVITTHHLRGLSCLIEPLFKRSGNSFVFLRTRKWVDFGTQSFIYYATDFRVTAALQCFGIGRRFRASDSKLLPTPRSLEVDPIVERIPFVSGTTNWCQLGKVAMLAQHRRPKAYHELCLRAAARRARVREQELLVTKYKQTSTNNQG